MINFCSEFVNVLLRNIGTHVDPRLLIQRIEYGMQVPGLRDSLVKILHDYNLQVFQCYKFFIKNYSLTLYILFLDFTARRESKDSSERLFWSS